MSNVSWLICLICASVGGTVFFSVNAVALRIFSHLRLQQAFEAAGKKQYTEKVIENSERLLLACSVYRLMLNVCILLLSLAAFAVAKEGNLRIADYILTFFVTTAIFSIFSLAIPHAWAKYAAEKVLSRSYKILSFLTTAAWPILYVFQLYDHFIRRLAGVVVATPEEEQEEKQEEFIKGLEQRRIEGVVDEEEQEMIENVLELSDTAASEIMTPRTDIIAVEVNSNLHTVVETMRSAGHTRVPVYKENIDNIIGFVYAKDLLSEIGKNEADFKLADKLRKTYFVPETKPLRVLLHEFQNQKLHIAVLLDEYGGTAGIVTLEDILEELVGEIADEYEKTPPKSVKQIDKNTIEADARTYIDDINDEFGFNLPEDEDYDTVGGFVFSHLGYIPKPAETFTYENLKFTIVSAEDRKIKRLRIQKSVER